MPITNVPPGGEQLSFVESLDPRGAVGAAAWSTANLASLVLVRVGRPLTISTIKIYIGTASGNVDVGVYSWDGTTATRLASAGSTVAAGASAIQTLTLSASVALVPGKDYFLGFAADNTTVTVGRLSVVGVIGYQGFRWWGKTASFPLPASFTGLSQASNATGLVAWMQGS